MELDFGDLDASWSFDQIPTSPLWAFADPSHFSDLRKPSASPFLDFSRFPSCNLEPVAENGHMNATGGCDDDGDKKKLPPPFTGFTPPDNLDVSFIIKERMTQALRYFKETTEQHQILAQVWAPVRSGNRYVHFVLGPHSNGLNQYRTVSLMYMFAVDGESDVTLGLPGRVFRQKLPEWTPNVQYYTSKEYPMVNHAKHYNVRGTLALPVFEPSGQSCVGVLELIMTSQKINYALEAGQGRSGPESA